MITSTPPAPAAAAPSSAAGRSFPAIAGAGFSPTVGAAALYKLPPAGDANTEHPRREDDPAGAVYLIRSRAHLVGECFRGPWEELR